MYTILYHDRYSHFRKQENIFDVNQTLLQIEETTHALNSELLNSIDSEFYDHDFESNEQFIMYGR